MNNLNQEITEKYATLNHSFTDPWLGDDEINLTYRFKRPNKADMSRFTKTGQKDLDKAQHNLVISLIHQDDKEKFLSELELYPGLLLSVSEWLVKAAGFASLGK